MKLIANFFGAHGTVNAGEEFEAPDEAGERLILRGLARHALPPTIAYQTKVIVPAEAPQVSAREPFRDVPHVDEKPQTLDSEGNKVLSTSNIFESRTIDPVGRGRRSGSAAGR